MAGTGFRVLWIEKLKLIQKSEVQKHIHTLSRVYKIQKLGVSDIEEKIQQSTNLSIIRQGIFAIKSSKLFRKRVHTFLRQASSK